MYTIHIGLASVQVTHKRVVSPHVTATLPQFNQFYSC